MRYPIGRISKLLGLSTETIRTYERKGIVHPQKNENGYRTFHVLDIGTLLRCRSYSCFGLSLSEAGIDISCCIEFSGYNITPVQYGTGDVLVPAYGETPEFHLTFTMGKEKSE